jgi:hypothetical protein
VWYRAFIDDRPDESVESADDILSLCAGLSGLQRQACITAASVVGPPDPRVQLSFCAELQGEEAVSCIRGTKVQNLIASPLEELVALIRQCDGFPAETRLACYRWLGKVLAVLTDGEFERYGLRVAARRALAAGLPPRGRRGRRAARDLFLALTATRARPRRPAALSAPRSATGRAR